MFKSFKFNFSLIFIISIITFEIYSCKDNSLVPPENLPGRRDYQWTIDTLKPPEGLTMPGWIWSNSSDNIWISGAAYLNGYCVWHYDGNSWTNYDPTIYWDPRGMYGTGSNNIWMGSTDGAFWHYDGSKWSKFCQTQIPDYQPFVAQGMCGNAPDNIYSVGYADSIDGMSYKAVIMHFDGAEWKQVDIPVIHNSFTRIIYDKSSGNFLIKGWIFDQSYEYIYSFDGHRLQSIFRSDKGLGNTLSINDQIYLSSVMDGKIYKLNKDNFNLFKEFSPDYFIGLIGGRRENDLFTINYDGLGHYNGNDLVTIYKKPNNDWSYDGIIAVFEKEIYSVWEDSYHTFIVHGKLN